MIVKKIILKVKWLWNDFLKNLGFGIKLKGHEGEVRVVCFHGVCEDRSPYINGRFIRRSQLRELLVELKKHVHFLSPEQFEKGELNSSKLNVLLTFDDGYLNNKTLLLPLLEELDLPALLFVTGQDESLWMDLFDIADHAQLSLDDLRKELQIPEATSRELKQQIIQSKPAQVSKISNLLTELTKTVRDDYKVYCELVSDEDVKELSEHPLITIGNHSYSHLSFPCLSAEEMAEELDKCQERFARCSVPKNRCIALPFAHYNSTVVQHLEKSNYTPIFVNEILPDTKENVVPRLTANPFISTRNQILAINHGEY